MPRNTASWPDSSASSVTSRPSAVPVLMVMMAVSRIGSALAAQIGMIGPVSTIVLSLLLLGEPMGPWQVVGTVLVMSGVFVVSRQKAA